MILAAPYPYVLYSDLYDHREFIRGIVSAGFSGLLWTPELRDAQNTEHLIRRLQSAVLSPMGLIDA
jgi:alpha-D-xyloside xylohydrolase